MKINRKENVGIRIIVEFRSVWAITNAMLVHLLSKISYVDE